MNKDPANSRSPLLRVCELSKSYRRRGSPWQRGHVIEAASHVTFEIFAGETLALVGMSGSGKSTVARCVSRLERPDAGEIWLNQTDIAQLESSDLAPSRQRCQMVFQDAATSINPRFTAGEVIEEPMLIQQEGSQRERRQRAQGLMSEVGLSPDSADRLAMEFSGGQQQRLAIARALALKPSVLILDEALSGLDLSTEAQIANLLLDLQSAHALAYLLISHDLALVARVSDTIAVMANGKIVEQGPTTQVIGHPTAPETRALLGATESARVGLAAAMGMTP
ncbi:MAG TPA: ATP-binding cassette domain-containing protein [Terriglobales bacterium]|jgi:ABC-type glutathione transport system ATPase component|nr:ATP-binding cassette domain-containing protein [Terriglobales bacterium]